MHVLFAFPLPICYSTHSSAVDGIRGYDSSQQTHVMFSNVKMVFIVGALIIFVSFITGRVIQEHDWHPL